MADNKKSSGKTGGLLDSGGAKAACCCPGRRLCSWIAEAEWAGLTLILSLQWKKKTGALWIDSAFHTVLSGLAFNSRRTVFTN